jgi:hypothetical protein
MPAPRAVILLLVLMGLAAEFVVGARGEAKGSTFVGVMRAARL